MSILGNLQSGLCMQVSQKEKHKLQLEIGLQVCAKFTSCKVCGVVLFGHFS
jgi:hypothetical protein